MVTLKCAKDFLYTKKKNLVKKDICFSEKGFVVLDGLKKKKIPCREVEQLLQRKGVRFSSCRDANNAKWTSGRLMHRENGQLL